MYQTDLTDAQWDKLNALIERHGPSPAVGGRARTHELRRVIEAILYLNKTGCQWRLLPTDFPPWETVYGYFRRWRLSGLWNRLWIVLREQARERAGRAATPTVAIVDSQSVKTTLKGGSAGMTRARKPRAGSATSRSIRKASCSQ